MSEARPTLIGVDWGTSRFRAFLIDDEGEAISATSSDEGLLSMGQEAWSVRLERLLGSWLKSHPDLPVLMCGMVGSAQGWQDAGYVACPAYGDALARGVVTVSGTGDRSVAIVPGVTGPSINGTQDVMRGEETQLVGLDDTADRQLVCLPGTHTKWVHVRGGVTETVTTHLSGELYGLLRDRSILSPVLGLSTWNEGAFQEGLRTAKQRGGLAHQLFGVRVRGLGGHEFGHAYLSGVLIGNELAAMEAELSTTATITMVGADHLARQYSLGLSEWSIQVRQMDPDTAVRRGLLKLARLAGLVTGRAS